jgi:hypothetical protein
MRRIGKTEKLIYFFLGLFKNAARSSETSIPPYQDTLRHITQHHNLDTYCHKRPENVFNIFLYLYINERICYEIHRTGAISSFRSNQSETTKQHISPRDLLLLNPPNEPG